VSTVQYSTVQYCMVWTVLWRVLYGGLNLYFIRGIYVAEDLWRCQ